MYSNDIDMTKNILLITNYTKSAMLKVLCAAVWMTLMCHSMWAAPVGMERARRVACRFMTIKKMVPADMSYRKLINYADLWAPNSFMPDLGNNDHFRFYGNHIGTLHVYIYNRRGALMAEMEGTDAQWDGTSHGLNCPQAAYVWKAVYTTTHEPQNKKQLIGTVVLIR